MTLAEHRILRAAIAFILKPAGMGHKQELDKAVRELIRARRAQRAKRAA